MSIIPAGFGEIVIPHQHSLLARHALVTFGVELPGTPPVVAMNALQSAWSTVWADTIDNNVTIGPIECRVGTVSGEALVVTADNTDPGTAARADSLNGGQAVLMHKRTARGGRRGRGRMYLPWYIGDDSVSEVGVLSSGAITSMNSRGASWLTTLEALTDFGPMVVLHSEGQSATGAPDEVTSLQVDQLVGSQRRRLGR